MINQIITGIYKINKKGELTRIRRNGRWGEETSIREIEPKGMYNRSTKTINGKIMRYSVHRLIWQYYNGKIPEGMEINHIDGNKRNNEIKNLEICTSKQNKIHAICIIKTIKCGWKSKLAKYDKKKYKEVIDLIKSNKRLCDIAKETGMKTPNICKIKKKLKKGYPLL